MTQQPESREPGKGKETEETEEAEEKEADDRKICALASGAHRPRQCSKERTNPTPQHGERSVS